MPLTSPADPLGHQAPLLANAPSLRGPGTSLQGPGGEGKERMMTGSQTRGN